MDNYKLSRLIVDDVMQKVNAGEQVFYMEYVRSVEALLNKYAAQQTLAPDVCHVCGETETFKTENVCAKCGTRR